jgi:hypothetical protein
MHGVVMGGGGGGGAAGLWLFALACLSGVVSAAGLQQQQQLQQQGTGPVCRGLHRAEVDWWVMLKHPRGYQYSYLDSTHVSSAAVSSCARGLCWQHGLSMQNPNPVSHTLEVLAAAAAGDDVPLAHVMYNDADAGGTEHFDFAHAKVSTQLSTLCRACRTCSAAVDTAAACCHALR